jgi:hypothetical protein
MSSLPKLRATLSAALSASASGFLQATSVLPMHKQAIKDKAKG